MPEPTHYEVLSLPKDLLEEANDEQIPQLIKQAYHRALLRHHPDKTHNPSSPPPPPPSSSSRPTSNHNTRTSTTSGPIYTVDQITRAYTTLSQPPARSEYDRHLLTQRDASKPARSAFQTGIETIDLDDLECSEQPPPGPGGMRWHRPCRCGNEQGFTLGEEDLDEAGDLGELIVGCQDCSLWLRVCFAVVEDEDEDEDDERHEAKELVRGMGDDCTGENGGRDGEAAAKQPG